MNIRSGYINIEFDGPMTLKSLQTIVDRADELEIPRDAIITFVSMDVTRTKVTLSINWMRDNGEKV